MPVVPYVGQAARRKGEKNQSNDDNTKYGGIGAKNKSYL